MLVVSSCCAAAVSVMARCASALPHKKKNLGASVSHASLSAIVFIRSQTITINTQLIKTRQNMFNACVLAFARLNYLRWDGLYRPLSFNTVLSDITALFTDRYRSRSRAVILGNIVLVFAFNFGPPLRRSSRRKVQVSLPHECSRFDMM